MAILYSSPSAVPTICTKFSTSAVPTIWAKCFALTTQKFNKGRTKPNLSPNGDRSGYKFRSVQGRGQAFFGETSWNGTSHSDELSRGPGLITHIEWHIEWLGLEDGT